MGLAIADGVLDAALGQVASGTRLTVCSAEPANFAGIAAVLLAEVTLTAGDGNGDYVISDGDASGRKVRVAGQSAIPVDATGTATHVAIDDGTTLLAVTTCDSAAITSGGNVSVPAFDLEVGDPEAEETGGTLLADVQWTTALGSSQTATSDGGVATIDEGGTGGQVLAVEAPATYGWDAHGPGNVLSILQTVDSWGHCRFDNMFPLPTSTERFWAMRFYHLVESGVDSNQDHPHCLWPVSTASDGGHVIEAVHLAIVVTSGGVGASLGPTEWLPRHSANFNGAGTNPFPFGVVPKTSGGGIIPFDKGAWYRFEHIFHWFNATEFRWYPRAYNIAGDLLYDVYDLKHTDTNDSLGDWYDASPANRITRSDTTANPNDIRAPTFGRGQTNPNSGFHYCVAAARFELRSAADDFIGPVT